MKKIYLAFLLLALLATACNPSKEELGSPDANFTASELESIFTVTQLDADGNTAADGNFFHYKVKNLARPVQILRTIGGNLSVVASGPEGDFAIKPSRGQDPTQSYIVRLANFDGTYVDLEKTATVYVPQEMTIDQKLLASESGSKVWQWDQSITGAVWGNMGYCGGAGSEVGLAGNGQWWGVTNEAEFADQLKHSDTGVLTGEESMDAKMVFTEDGTITCYDAAGNVVRTGTYEVADFDNSDPTAWKVGNLNTSAGAILWPFEINSGGNKPTTFEICYLTVDKMTLVYPDGGDFGALGGWGEATFWHFKSDSDVSGALTDYNVNGKAWTWDQSITGAVWGNMGYCGGAGSEVGLTGNGQWWGVTNEEEFGGQLQHSDTGALTGEESMDAYMIFTPDGSITSYDANGNKVRGGIYELETVSDNEWKVANLVTSAGSILWPFEINSGGNKPTDFEVVYLTGDKMTLVYPDGGDFGGLGNWGEATFWHFKKK